MSPLPHLITRSTLILGLLVVLPRQLLRGEQIPDSPLSFLTCSVGGLLFLLGAGLAFSGTYYLVRRGEGLPWSWTPPQRLVVAGPYTHVQHPILLGVLLMLGGEALWEQSTAIALYAGTLLVLANLYLVAIEEPTLEKHFGPDYRAYRTAVPRWIPFWYRQPPSPH